MAIIFALTSMLFWGLALFLAAVASRRIGNILTLFWMQVFGFVIGCIYLLFNPNLAALSLLPPRIPILSVIALLQIIGTLAYYKGMIKGQVSLVSPLGASYGLVTAILSVIILKEVLKPSQSVAILLIIFGMIIISVSFNDLIKNKNIKLMTGTKEGITAMFGWGISLFLLIFPAKELGWLLPSIFFRILMIIFLAIYILSIKISIFPKTKKLPLILLIFTGFLIFWPFSVIRLAYHRGMAQL